jgi:type I restriction enzyme S subunit
LGELENLNKYLVKENDIVIGMDGSKVGKNIALIKKKDENSILIQRVARIRTNNKSDINFVYQHFISYKFREYVDRVNTSSGIPHISAQQIKEFKTGFPPELKEQQKIASCLSSLDEVIAVHSQKLATFKDHKKGLMQNLFPTNSITNDELEITNVPNYRFPEFLEDGEWVVTTVEKLIQEKILFPPKDGNHGSIHPKSSDYVKTGIPFIMASDLKNGQIDFFNCTHLKKDQADSLQKGFAMSGDVLLTHKGTVGEVALLGELEYPYIMLTPQVTYYRIKDKFKLVNGFLSAFFNSDFFQRNLVKVSGGGTRAYVGITKQKEFNIHYPKNPEEQKRIASCLSSLDDLITAQVEKIAQLKLHKKGLMQSLFPKSITN